MSFKQQGLPQDWPALAGWLAAQGHALETDPAPRQFAGGLANLNYRVLLDGAPAVFRRPPGGELAHGASDMAREAKVLTGLNRCFPLAPGLIAFCDDRSVLGVPFQILEFRPGAAIGGELPTGFTVADAGWLLDALSGAMAALHAIDPAAAGLADLGKPTGFAERQLRGWTKRAAAAFAEEAPPQLAALLARMEAGLPPDPPAGLLHMDPKFDNLLVDAETRSATALIDWDMATLGPPAFDLAVLLSYWIEPGDPQATHSLSAVPSLAPDWPGRDAVIQSYARASGGIPPHLGWHLALARLRLATAWMQLYRLWQQGSLEGTRYAGFAHLASAILAHALDSFGDTP
ncbi:phosphotransferase family protein [Sandaracinobacteroides hominis]|uniref:phosphotransferase family protein n=1 Tax=Sandaracinobacteroides hominis TaxID=2780086 RepID=UPI0018F45868|nr:phosphotransferase family protein [Sandaracinobacteroides hominis]